MGKGENKGTLETIAARDLKVARCRQLMESMEVCTRKLIVMDILETIAA